MGMICGLCFAIGCALPKLFNLNFWDVVDQTTGPDVEAGEPVNILLLGIDARPGEVNARSDTMMLACVDPAKKKVALISIPRDSRVYVPGSVDKINGANAVGGPREACRAVERLMGVDVDYYVLTNFSGFSKCIDILGGVTLDVEKRMYKPSEGINLRPGVQHLDGKAALAYVRFRGDALGDIGRTERQQKFLTAFASELLKSKNILKLPSLIPELKKNIKTNMGLKTMLALAGTASSFKPESLICQTLPGYFFDDPDNGLSYWIVDKTKIDGMIASLFAGRKVAVVEEAPYCETEIKSTQTSNIRPKQSSDVVSPTEPTDTVEPLEPTYPDADEGTDGTWPEDEMIPDSNVPPGDSTVPPVVEEPLTPSTVSPNIPMIQDPVPASGTTDQMPV